MDLIVLIFAPPLHAADERPLRAVRAIEENIPGVSLRNTVSDKGALVPLSDRDAFITRASADDGLPIICDADRECPTIFNGTLWPGVIGPGGEALVQVVLQTSRLLGGRAASRLLAALGESMRAYWGTATPDETASKIGSQIIHDPTQSPPQGLPALNAWTARSRRDVPAFLGWINFWSRDTAERLGFPRPIAVDALPLESGAWIWQTTSEPLTLDRPDHVDALASAYETWLQIGDRD